jgi:hypothetical protein
VISEPDALAIKARHETEWLAIDGVHGVGLGEADGEYVINVYVDRDRPEVRAQLPERVERCAVVPVESGGFEAYPG